MIKRRNIPGLLRRQIWHLTAGKCHICGKRLKKSEWHVGHIIAHARGGPETPTNLLPICVNCNLILKEAKGSKAIKKILRLGVWGESEIRRKTVLGKQLIKLYRDKKFANIKRRRRNRF